MRTRTRGFLTGIATTLVALAPASALAATSSLPTGKAITLTDIVTLVTGVGTTLATIAGIVVVAVIIWAGITMATAGGDDKRFAKGKAMLWEAIIGAIVILGVGMIVATINSFATNPTQILR